MDSNIETLVEGHRDAVTVRRVFGDSYEKDGVTVIPTARVMGGGGGGAGEAPDQGRGSGTGFGLAGRPAGVYVIRGDDVRWRPAVDVNRIIGGALLLTALTLFLRTRRAHFDVEDERGR